MDPLFPIEAASLTSIVRGMLGKPSAIVASWQVEPLAHRVINRVTAGLHRITGLAKDGEHVRHWSVVLKVLHLPADDATSPFNGSVDPRHWNYWRREADLYHSGLLNTLPGGIAAPRCYGVTELRPGVVGVWLEAIAGLSALDWSVERFGLAAQHLGQTQGAFAAGTPLRDQPWLSREWLSYWIFSDEQSARLDIATDATAWRHPLVAELFPQSAADDVLHLWQDRDAFRTAIARVPRTLCHFDCWPSNMFSRLADDEHDETVLIDWSMAGHGVLGEDIANLVMDSNWMMPVDSALLPALEHNVVEGYLQGLRDAGWRGDERIVRGSYAAVAALRFGLLAGWLLAQVHDEAGHAQLEARWERPVAAFFTNRAAVVRRSLELAAEARALLPYM